MKKQRTVLDLAVMLIALSIAAGIYYCWGFLNFDKIESPSHVQHITSPLHEENRKVLYDADNAHYNNGDR